MPKKAINYDNTIIYKIICIDNPKFVYVGNTTDFVQRKHAHKRASPNSDLKLYQMIRSSGWESCQMIPIKVFPCKSSIDAQIEVDRIRDELVCI